MMIPGMAPGSVLVGPAAAAAMWITDSNVWVSAASGFPLVRSGGDVLPFVSFPELLSALLCFISGSFCSLQAKPMDIEATVIVNSIYSVSEMDYTFEVSFKLVSRERVFARE
jgi:hypothetical protein